MRDEPERWAVNVSVLQAEKQSREGNSPVCCGQQGKRERVYGWVDPTALREVMR